MDTNSSRTWVPKKADKSAKWYLIDAEGLVLGRLAAEISKRLRGKHKATYTPNTDMGDHIVVVNADKIVLTGNKRSDKMYYRHTGYPGGIKEASASFILDGRYPERVLHMAVKRMIAKGPLGREVMKKLHLYNGSDHPHAGQKPEVLDFGSQNSKNRLRSN